MLNDARVIYYFFCFFMIRRHINASATISVGVSARQVKEQADNFLRCVGVRSNLVAVLIADEPEFLAEPGSVMVGESIEELLGKNLQDALQD